jgi:hypothetical protein
MSSGVSRSCGIACALGMTKSAENARVFSFDRKDGINSTVTDRRYRIACQRRSGLSGLEPDVDLGLQRSMNGALRSDLHQFRVLLSCQ